MSLKPNPLQAVLEQQGLRFSPPGFPHALPVSGSQEPLAFYLDQPLNLESFSPKEAGFAVYSQESQLQAAWGLLAEPDQPHASQLPELIHKTVAKGAASLTTGQTYLTARLHQGQVVLLALRIEELGNAYLALRNATKEAVALRRIGKALAMNQNLEPLAMMVTHVLNNALEIAAVLLWSNENRDDTFELIASVGLERDGTQRLYTLKARPEPRFLAEAVVQSGQPLWIDHVAEHPLTAKTEAAFAYLPVGPVAVLPLRVGTHTIGVLELLARDGDRDFLASQDLHVTIAEHLALALHSAALFEKFESLAKVDPLTGIANHRSMQDFLAENFEEACQAQTGLSVVMVDVDHFRRFNEEEGHDCGDDVLRLVAQVLKETVRPGDLAARYGGEEFTLVLPGYDLAQAANIAENARLAIERLEYRKADGTVRKVTASFGCASYPAVKESPMALLKAADEALYQAKRDGRNRVATAPEPRTRRKAS